MKTKTNQQLPEHIYSRVLKQYFQEIGEEEPLSSEEEISLAIRVKQGDDEALDKLLRANLRFVVSVAKKYQGHGLSLSDLINEGNIGLIKAARRFDETRGFKFISYAVWWIKQTILQSISENSRLVRLPLNVVGNIKKLSRAATDFQSQYEREPSQKELEYIMESEKIDQKTSLQQSDGVLSIDAPLPQDKKSTLKDILPTDNGSFPQDGIMEESFKSEIDEALKTLDSREEMIIRYYFGINRERPATLEEIGEILDLTRERVRQIKEKAIRKLRHISRTEHLRSYLG